jgi:ABC-2 type transport system ATP-binding protein
VPAPDAALVIRDLRKTFTGPRPWREVLRRPFSRRRVTALDGVDLVLPWGAVVALVGPNGAGKTTLLKVLCSLIAPDAGDVFVAGHDGLRETIAARRNVGLVTADERSFYWRLTGRHNLEFFAALHGLHGRESRARIDALLERVDLSTAGDTPFREYSTGMKQKLALCRGLIHRPRVLLLDEPTRGIDLAALRALRAVLREHVATGGSVLLASHDLAEIEALDCAVALLRDGRVTGAGTVPELRQSLRIAEVVELRFAGGAAEAMAWVTRLAADARVAAVAAEGETVAVTLAPETEIGALVASIHAGGGHVVRIRPRGAGLESVVDASQAATNAAVPAAKPADRT